MTRERERERKRKIGFRRRVRGEGGRKSQGIEGLKRRIHTRIELIRFHGLDNGRSKSRVTIII